MRLRYPPFFPPVVEVVVDCAGRHFELCGQVVQEFDEGEYGDDVNDVESMMRA